MGIYTNAVQKLYVAYFSRPADASGLTYWEGVVAANKGSTAAVSAAFAASDEYKATFAGQDAYHVVATVYQNLFGRAAEPAGLAYWGQALINKTFTIDSVVTQIAAGAQGTDLAAYNNKVAAATAFTVALDTTAEILAYSGINANVAAKAFIASITTDASLTAALVQTALDAAVKVVVDAGTPPPVVTTFNMTTGIDTIVGTGGNDVFVGNTAAGAYALTSFDSIDGGAGNDALVITTTTAIDTTSTANVTIKNIETANLTSALTVVADTTGWTGLTALNVASIGGETLTAAATTAVTATDTAGPVSVTGGSTQTVVAKGGLTLSGAAGAIVASDTAQAAANSSITGGTNVTVTASGVTTGTITIGGATTAPTGTVVLTATDKFAATGTAGAISVTGGTTVAVTQNITSSSASAAIVATGGTVGVTGTASTTSVTVNQSAAVTAAAAVVAVAEVKTAGDVTTAAVAAKAAVSGVVDGAVTITDANAGSTTAAATIATVTLGNYGNSTISSNALATLNLSGNSGTLGLTSGLTTETVTALALNLSGLTGTNTITDSSNHFKTVNIATSGSSSTLAGFADTAATALNVSGDSALTITSAAGMTTLAKVTVAGAGGLTAALNLGTITDVNASASTGSNKITMDSTKATYEGGSGSDNVTISAVSTKVIDGGAGNDTLTVNAASYATSAKNINFETLAMGGAASGSFDAAGFTGLAAGAITGNSSFINVAAGAGLTLTGATGFIETVTLANATGTADSFNLTIKAGATGANSVAVAGVETVNISLVDTAAAGHVLTTESLTLSDSSAQTINISGAGTMAMTLIDTDTAITTVDASGLANAGFTFVSGNLAAAASIKGSAAHTNTVDFSAATTAAVTYTGGSGNDAITASSKNNVISLGNGTNSVTGTTGNQTITGGSGNDTVTLGSGNNNVNLGDGANSFTATSGNNTYVGGAGVDTIVLGSTGGALGADHMGVNNITLGAGADIVTLHGTSIDSAHYTVIADAVAGDTIVFSGASTVNGTAAPLAQVTGLNAATSVFLDWVNAASTGTGAVNGIANWFQFNGNTYIVIDNSASATFVNGTDSVVQLTGLVDLSATHATATFGANSITLLLA